MNRDAPPKNWPTDYVIREDAQGAQKSWALYSPDEVYRYRLRRYWAEGRRAAFLMLNPSTATELKNDPTVARCEARAKKLGYGGFEVVNIFALRSTNPRGLYESADPAGALNDRAISEAIANSDDVICAWGAHGDLNGQSAKMRELLHSENAKTFHLGLTKKGEPKHPLYLSYDIQPEKWIL